MPITAIRGSRPELIRISWIQRTRLLQILLRTLAVLLIVAAASGSNDFNPAYAASGLAEVSSDPTPANSSTGQVVVDILPNGDIWDPNQQAQA